MKALVGSTNTGRLIGFGMLFAVTVALVSFGIGSLPSLSASQPSAVDFGLDLNKLKAKAVPLSRDSYEKALAKWKAQNIEEYELTTSRNPIAPTEETLRVSDRGNTVLVQNTSYIGIGTPDPGFVTPFPTPGADYYKEYTVEGIFAEIANALYGDPNRSTPTATPVPQTHREYKVVYDDKLGYPLYFSNILVADPGSDLVFWDFDASSSTVRRFRVLNQGSPVPVSQQR